jgi:hypothetical protein
VTAPGRARLRAGVVLLAVIQAVTGAWQYFAPRAFYDLPTVGAGATFNEHLMTDIGGLGLALAVVLAAAARRMERSLVQAALAGYLVYSVSHLAFHVTHLDRLPTTDAALQLTGLVLLPAFALALLLSAAQATAPDGRPDPGEGEPAPPEPALRAGIPPRTASRRTADDHKPAEGNRL